MNGKCVDRLIGKYCKIVTKEPGEKKATVVTGIVNNVDASPSQYGMSVKNVTVNGFTVDFSGAMDTDNYALHWIVSRDLIL